MTKDQLAGVWRLKEFEFTDAKGGLFYPLGERPEGTLVVTNDGYAVFSFFASGRPKFASDDVFGGKDAEYAAAAKGYASFGGPCEVTEDSISVRVEFSLFPNWIGGTQIRRYEIDGDVLTLRTLGARVLGGVERSGRARLERM
jgi:hypothetical protein